MPIYEYQCTSCHHHFDLMQKISDPPETICPECTQPTAKKLVSAAGFQLKGTGWYATDFKNKNTPAKDTPSKEATKTTETTTAAPATSTTTTDKGGTQ